MNGRKKERRRKEGRKETIIHNTKKRKWRKGIKKKQEKIAKRRRRTTMSTQSPLSRNQEGEEGRKEGINGRDRKREEKIDVVKINEEEEIEGNL